MLALLKGAVSLTGDPDLGLKAAREIATGDYGVVEFMVNSSRNLRDAIELLGRYLPLLNDTLQFSLCTEAGRATVRLDSRILLPRAAADFQSAAFYLATLRRGIIDPEYEARFIHARPDDVGEYPRTFAPGRLRFGAEFNGFVFDARMLDLPLASADLELHTVLRRYADMMLADLPRAETLADKVQKVLARSSRAAKRT